jgi:hypothetical protein
MALRSIRSGRLPAVAGEGDVDPDVVWSRMPRDRREKPPLH